MIDDADPAQLSVLLVEDDESVARALCIGLRSAGFHTDLAPGASAALEARATGAHDLFLVDLGLPEMDGTDVVRAIRRSSDAPIIVISARDERTGRESALDAGADDHLAKPFSIDALLSRIAAVRRGSKIASGPPRAKRRLAIAAAGPDRLARTDH